MPSPGRVLGQTRPRAGRWLRRVFSCAVGEQQTRHHVLGKCRAPSWTARQFQRRERTALDHRSSTFPGSRSSTRAARSTTGTPSFRTAQEPTTTTRCQRTWMRSCGRWVPTATGISVASVAGCRRASGSGVLTAPLAACRQRRLNGSGCSCWWHLPIRKSTSCLVWLLTTGVGRVTVARQASVLGGALGTIAGDQQQHVSAAVYVDICPCVLQGT
jgi:hypothetical protein